MTSAELLVDAFGRIRQVVHRVVAGLTPEQLAFRAATVAACGSGGAGWPGCSASKACQQNEKAQHTSVQCRRIARRFLTWKSAQPSSSQPIWSVAGQRVVVGPSPMRRDIPCLTEVGPRGVEAQRRWRILSTPDLGAGRLEDPFGLDNGPAEAAERILAARPRGDGGGKAVLGGLGDVCADPPDPAAGGLELGEVHLRVVPSPGPGGDRWAVRVPEMSGWWSVLA